jgi:hypothetical protein
VAVKVAEVQNMARHVLRNALVLWLPGQHLNRSCKSGEATKATGKQKWPTLRNVGIGYRLAAPLQRVACIAMIEHATAIQAPSLSVVADNDKRVATTHLFRF